MQSDLPRQVFEVCEEFGVDPARICFAITETTAVNFPETMGINMTALNGRGVSFALDDYGSGFTDLSYVMNLPFGEIKLAQEVVLKGFESAKGSIALESTIALIRSLGRKIVAEGVETAAQAEALSSFGCEYLQGFLFSPPVEGADFGKLLEADARWRKDI
jgi:EAL domain-containing protein (putative c-di-GMP-specific phosphodiesterase class I)